MSITFRSIVRRWGWAFGLLSLASAAGCGSSAPPPASSGGGDSLVPAAAPASGNATRSSPASTRPVASNEVHTDAAGRKWIGPNLPYDVFFEDPLAVASNTQQVAAVAPGGANGGNTAAAPTEAPAAASSDAKPAAGAASDWKSVVAMKYIEAETKKIRNRLTENLQSIGKYNGNYKDSIQVDGSVLAALGGIVAEHPEEISWKANAKYVREFGMQIEQNSQGLGKKPYDATLASFEQLVSVLDGNKPAEAGDVAEKVPFAESADRAALMKRMDRAFGHMKKNVTTEAIFKSTAEDVAHETVMLAAMSKVVAMPGYLSSEEDSYKKHAEALIAACMDMEKAIQVQDFKQFSDALNKVTKKCDECHVDYRFADGS